ncbi:MAG: RpiB/LacA/LacB family sugar-phosphate isomerase [Candidatus Magasanikbacteria bacterium]|nr:RpiB/LacA/LacB family sugar-phosphate isomerase [Candidatus Magasanikbacteria bacterium]
MIFITSDHRGFQLKKHLLTYIKTQLHKSITDLGPKTYNKEDDFVDFAIKLGKKINKKKKDIGISICGSGHGMCITANKIKGIRAIVGYSIEGAELGRKDNDANILCLSGNVLSNDHADAIVKKFLETKFDGLDRRVRRLKKISALEK